MEKYGLEIGVFICGAAVMILELVGSRILAPYLGTSIYVWTSLIGIILSSLSLGYVLGGKLADKKPTNSILSLIIFVSALTVAFSAFSNTYILTFISKITTHLPTKSILAATIIFFPSSVLLGMVSPYAVRLRLKSVHTSTSTVGNLYAISTVGSIFGTFLAGFILISFLGSGKIMMVVSIILILTAVIVDRKIFSRFRILTLGTVIILYMTFSSLSGAKQKADLVDIDTNYYRVWIYNAKDPKTKKKIRVLRTDPFGAQAAIFLNDSDLVFDYTKFYRLAQYINPNMRKALMIGGGVYTYPRDFVKRNPQASIDVVEIDPKFTDLAKQYFGFVEDPRINVFNEDGRTFLNRKKSRYDAIFLDAFKSLETPYQLITREAIVQMHKNLVPDGIVLANIISSIEGPRSKLLRAEYATFKQVFPQVYLFPLKSSKDDVIQNIMLLALKSDKPLKFDSDNDELNNYLDHLWKKGVGLDTPVLTDDFAPVDYYSLPLIAGF